MPTSQGVEIPLRLFLQPVRRGFHRSISPVHLVSGAQDLSDVITALPLLDFVVPIVCPLDVPCVMQVSSRPPRTWAVCTIPVFIITWVVARLTFFLNPAHDISALSRKCFHVEMGIFDVDGEAAVIVFDGLRELGSESDLVFEQVEQFVAFGHTDTGAQLLHTRKQGIPRGMPTLEGFGLGRTLIRGKVKREILIG